MIRGCIIWFCAATLATALTAKAQSPQPVSALSSGRIPLTTTNLMPPTPSVAPPVTFFRQLLSLPPIERNQLLASRPPEARARIQAKIREYLALDPNERELRLRATELRWYLVPMMRLAPADRTDLLAQVPAELLSPVKTRLMQWDILPPALQAEFLANDKTLHYLTQAATPSTTIAAPDKIADQFSHFFDLLPKEKQQLLGMLSASERAQMEKTLQSFDQLPAAQRAHCLRNFAKFAGMSGAERAEFLKNAESWSKMSPEERQTWRDLVANVPLLPPGSTAHLPPLPPAPPTIHPSAPKPSMATN